MTVEPQRLAIGTPGLLTWTLIGDASQAALTQSDIACGVMGFLSRGLDGPWSVVGPGREWIPPGTARGFPIAQALRDPRTGVVASGTYLVRLAVCWQARTRPENPRELVIARSAAVQLTVLGR